MRRLADQTNRLTTGKPQIPEVAPNAAGQNVITTWSNEIEKYNYS